MTQLRGAHDNELQTGVFDATMMKAVEQGEEIPCTTAIRRLNLPNCRPWTFRPPGERR